jgi:HK97 family phage major capsid protein
MSTIIETLAQRREGLISQATEIAKRGVAESRDLTVEEQTSFDQMFAEAEGLASRMQAIGQGEQRAADIEASFRSSHREQEHRDEGEGAFGKWAREARIGDGYDLERERGAEARAIANRGRGIEARAMSATGGIGASSVYSTLWEYAVAGSQILQAGVQIINTADGNTLPMPKVTVHATGASAAASAPITAGDATITTADLSVTKDGYLTLVPNELLQDATFDIEGYLARAAGRELGRKISAKASAAVVAGFTVTGVTGPTGAASGTLGAQATAGQGGDVLIDLFHSVLPEYRTTASWLMSDTVAAMVRKLKNTAGDYVWEKSLQVGNPPTIDGKGVYIDSFLPSFVGTPATDSAKKIIYFGDFSALVVRIAGGLRFERSSEAAFANDQTAFRAIVRAGAVALDPNAVKFLLLS